VDLTSQHKNHSVVIEGPEIRIRVVGMRSAGSGDLGDSAVQGAD